MSKEEKHKPKHSVTRGETGTMTSKTGKTDNYDGKRRYGVAEGSSGQQGAGHDDR